MHATIVFRFVCPNNFGTMYKYAKKLFKSQAYVLQKMEAASI